MVPGSDIPRNEKLSEALRRLLEEAGGKEMAVREMIDVLQGRGLQMIIILLCLPFLAPVTIPGISIPFGLTIAVCGLRVGFGHKPWLPRWILERKVSYHALERMVEAGCRIYARVEKLVKPRLPGLLEGTIMGALVGLSIAVSGLLLSLPIPPPFFFTNTIPGFAIVFLALGVMERDGALTLAGHALTIVALIYVGGIGFLGKELLHYFSGA